MRGHIRKRGENSHAVILYDPTTRKQKWHTIHGDRGVAEKYLTDILSQQDKGTYVEPSKITVKQYLERWLEDYAEQSLEHSTYHSYRGIIKNHIIPALGFMPLCKLLPIQVQEFYTKSLKSGRCDGKGKELSPASVLKFHRVLHEALHHAMEWQLIGRNVCDCVKPPRHAKLDEPTLERIEIDTLIDAARETDIYIPVALAVYTGMRRGEIVALKWRDVDLDAGYIQVRQAAFWNRDKKCHELKRTKTRHSRKVDMPRQLMNTLDVHKLLQKAQKKELGDEYQKSGLVCANIDGSMISLDHVSKAFKRLAAKLRLKVTFHGLRHTHATLLHKMGAAPKAVAERLGNSVEVVMKTYSHVTPSVQKELIQKLEDYFD